MTWVWAQTGEVPATYDSISASRAAETREFINRKNALQRLPAGPQRELQLKQEIQRHLAENKKLSLQQEALRRETITDLKKKWNNVEADWKKELVRHDAVQQKLEKLPEGPDRTAKIEAENASHRAKSKQISVERNVVHEGVMNQANREVMGGSTNQPGDIGQTKGAKGTAPKQSGANVSNEIKQTAGTKVTDPNHRGMNGDIDAGGGYRTTEKAAKILDEIGVKDSLGQRVKVKNGVLETNGDFGMTINADAGVDRVGSSGHQAQVKQAAAHGETYISETGGAVKSKILKDDLAILDHTKKAHGVNEPPGKLVGSPEGQGMVKGALKAANQAKLPPETIEAIARKNGIANPERILDRMAEIKAGKSTIVNAEEAAKLQGVSRDILNTAEASTKAAAKAEVEKTKTKIADLETKGKVEEARRLREEVADYNAKADASRKAIAEAEHGSPQGAREAKTKSPSPGAEPPPVETPGTAAGRKPKVTATPEPAVAGKRTGAQPRVSGEPAPKAAVGGKLLGAAGLALGAYGIYEGYKTACEEMAAGKQGESKGLTGWTANKAELAGRTLWHGLGFGAAADIGQQAGRDSFEQYKKDIAAGKVSPDSWTSYGMMKVRSVAGALFGGVKAISYDAAKSSGTSLGEAVGGLVGVGKDNYDLAQNSRNESRTKAEQSKKVYDTLIKNGASPVGAQRAADGVLKGDFTEAKRLMKVLDGKRAASLTIAPKTAESEKRTSNPLKSDPPKVSRAQPETKGKLDSLHDAAGGQIATAAAQNTVSPGFSVSLSPALIEVAPDQEFRVDAKPSGGKAPYTYTWTGDGKPSSVNSSGLKGKRKKDSTLVVEVRDGNGRVATATCRILVVSENPPTAILAKTAVPKVSNNLGKLQQAKTVSAHFQSHDTKDNQQLPNTTRNASCSNVPITWSGSSFSGSKDESTERWGLKKTVVTGTVSDDGDALLSLTCSYKETNYDGFGSVNSPNRREFEESLQIQNIELDTYDRPGMDLGIGQLSGTECQNHVITAKLKITQYYKGALIDKSTAERLKWGLSRSTDSKDIDWSKDGKREISVRFNKGS
jgi:hypothetical protein